MELLRVGQHRRWPAALALLPAVLSLGGCKLVRDPSPIETATELVAVHAMLVAGEDTARVLLTRAQALAVSPPLAVEPVPGASVRLIRGEEGIELDVGGDCVTRFGFPNEPDLAAGCYAGAVSGGIVTGARYELEITLPGGARIEGATTVPEPPALLEPAPGAELEVRFGPVPLPEPFVAAWRVQPSGRRTEISLRAVRRDCTALLRLPADASASFLDVTGSDSAELRTGFVGCGGESMPERLDAHLVLTVYDANYTAYAKAIDSPYAIARNGAAVGLRGAAGVFGSAAVASVPVVLVRR
ncbi:MAG TPA: DUF4249 family protein [Longimicrobiales bacterium]